MKCKQFQASNASVLESTSSLLMNLLLTEKGKKACNKNCYKVLGTLLTAIESTQDCLRGNLNGTIYSLLSLATFRKAATELNIQNAFKTMLLNSSEALRNQINCILTRICDPSASDIVEPYNDEALEISDCEDDTENDDDISNPMLAKFIAEFNGIGTQAQ
jgi:hypothetical protein